MRRKRGWTAELEQIEEELREVKRRCVRSRLEGVERCEEALKSAMLTKPINQLRQHLHAGEPCLVCGATEHPFADAVEPESEELLQNAENTLADAKTDEKAAEARIAGFADEADSTEQDKHNAYQSKLASAAK